MNSRFAEVCRTSQMDLTEVESAIERMVTRDGRTQKDIFLKCEKDICIGVFFDGTNNNKYRDTPGYSQSNVARLYEVFPGTPARQTAPTFRPRVMPDGSKQPLLPFPDSPFEAASVAPDDFPYYRKIYLPGLGTPMPDVGDTGSGLDRSLGLAGAFRGQARLEWAMVQLLNQVHAAIFKSPIEASIDLSSRWQSPLDRLARASVLGLAEMAYPDFCARLAELLNPINGPVEKWRFEKALGEYAGRRCPAR